MASDVATMLPTMILRPSARARSAVAQRFGQTARLVELDVHRVVASHERSERGAVMHGLIGTNRHGPRDPRKKRILAGGQRLLDKLDACVRRGGERATRFHGLARPRSHRR